MQSHFDNAPFSQCWHAESNLGQHKHCLKSALTSCRDEAQSREIILRVLTNAS